MHIRSLILFIIIILLFISVRHSDAMTVRDIIISPLFKNAKREAQNAILKKYNVTWKEVREAQKQDDIETRKRIYCTDSSPKVSFYFPGIPTPYKINHGESYSYSDQQNKNSYQFNYNNLCDLLSNSTVSAEEYIDKAFNARCKVTGATILEKKVDKEHAKTSIFYVTKSTAQGINKTSYHKYVIDGAIYYNWSVHSYENKSNYSAEYLYDKYSKYVGMANGYCN